MIISRAHATIGDERAEAPPRCGVARVHDDLERLRRCSTCAPTIAGITDGAALLPVAAAAAVAIPDVQVEPNPNPQRHAVARRRDMRAHDACRRAAVRDPKRAVAQRRSARHHLLGMARALEEAEVAHRIELMPLLRSAAHAKTPSTVHDPCSRSHSPWPPSQCTRQ